MKKIPVILRPQIISIGCTVWVLSACGRGHVDSSNSESEPKESRENEELSNSLTMKLELDREKVDFDEPSDGYFQGYLNFREAEKESEKAEAVRRLQRSLDCFYAVRKRYPDWKREMVDGRIAITEEMLAHRSQ